MLRLTSSAYRDYLKTIYLLGQAKPDRRIPTGKIAQRLGVRAASVTGMLGRLAADGLVDYKKRAGARLTDPGEKIALQMVRRHRLIETFLFEKLGYRWDEVHGEAERLEHGVTADFCQRLDEILGFPTADPHGAPIPNRQLDRPFVSATRLATLRPGSQAKIIRLSDRDALLLQEAATYDLRPGAIVHLVAGPPITLRHAQAEKVQTITPSLGKIIYVEILSLSK